MAEAFQRSKATKDGDAHHEVGVRDLNVYVICEDDNVWYAQGVEIDYIAQGDSFADVCEAFATGLRRTIAQHLTIHGTIANLLCATSEDVLQEFRAAGGHASYQLSTTMHKRTKTFPPVSREELEQLTAANDGACEVVPAPNGVPYERIAYHPLSECA